MMLKASHVCSRAENKAKNTENFRMNEVSCENDLQIKILIIISMFFESKFLYQQIIERLRCINNNAPKFFSPKVRVSSTPPRASYNLA